MRSLGDLLAGSRPAPTRARRYRAEARFVTDISKHCTPLDRNGRAKLIAKAEAIERASKLPGKRSGVLGLTGLTVLRVLVLHFANRGNGLCNPSYSAIQKQTGFCRQTICRALRSLEAAGLLIVTRRLVRREIERNGVTFVQAVQGSNLYAFCLSAVVPIRALVGSSKSFPKPNALLALLFNPSLPGRGKHSQGIPIGAIKRASTRAIKGPVAQ
ncbi:helix-turn-helix domain-containing protein [Filomicrobium sp.]|uniref:helix-turn-helix domain-containing protein n=1 Tax=Filomicrobium sp. TaxID=2024831 RepID=UPI00258D65A4|nr:helix-turn-helix domain-containing protein [Filomicrobium sp.]MCV0371742.1 helix-turn-helix domain-containing protein [Filomicrobium sp.]